MLSHGIWEPTLQLLLPRVRGVSIEAEDLEDSPPLSPAYEELVEVVTCVIAKLNIYWPAEKQEACSKSKLDVHFLSSNTQPPHQGVEVME